MEPEIENQPKVTDKQSNDASTADDKTRVMPDSEPESTKDLAEVVNEVVHIDLPHESKIDPTRDTAVLSSNMIKRLIKGTDKAGTASLGGMREVVLVIRGMVERIVMSEGTIYQLGRFDVVGARKAEEIDLSPYGALDRGVSRVHATLHLQNDQLYLTDLNSTNGTYLAGQRLKPNEANVIRKGDEVLIGRLPVQILFKN
jgi:hypothetical protein